MSLTTDFEHPVHNGKRYGLKITNRNDEIMRQILYYYVIIILCQQIYEIHPNKSFCKKLRGLGNVLLIRLEIKSRAADI